MIVPWSEPTKMAGLGLKCVFFISLLIAALVVQAEADATVINISGGSPVVFYVNGKKYSVGVTDVHVKVEGKNHQAIVVKGADGKNITVNVSDGDVVVVVPDFAGHGSGIVVSVNGNEFH